MDRFLQSFKIPKKISFVFHLLLSHFALISNKSLKIVVKKGTFAPYVTLISIHTITSSLPFLPVLYIIFFSPCSPFPSWSSGNKNDGSHPISLIKNVFLFIEQETEKKLKDAGRLCWKRCTLLASWEGLTLIIAMWDGQLLLFQKTLCCFKGCSQQVSGVLFFHLYKGVTSVHE